MKHFLVVLALAYVAGEIVGGFACAHRTAPQPPPHPPKYLTFTLPETAVDNDQFCLQEHPTQGFRCVWVVELRQWMAERQFAPESVMITHAR